MSKPLRFCKSLKAVKGYGLAMLMMFIVNTVMIATSLQLIAGPIGLLYLGSSSQNSLSARQIAEIGLADAKADIQSRLNSLQSVTTAYTLTNSINMPGNPASPGTLDSALGSYTASLPYARGDLYILQVTGTVGSASHTLYDVLNLGIGHQKPLDYISGANAAYGLRKLRAAYSGSAIRVRRPSDNAEQDIGFLPDGSLDLVSLRTFLGSTLPLDNVSGAVGAYSLRKLRAAYTGAAIRVRRSSDSAERDIGFTSAGDLDTASLMSFVGSDHGLVRTWYDQSGNGNDGVSTTDAYQPYIILSGVLQMVNGRPVVRYNSDEIRLPMVVSDNMTLTGIYGLTTGIGDATAGTSAINMGRVFHADASGTANDFCVGVDSNGYPTGTVGNPDTSVYAAASMQGPVPDNQIHWLAFTRDKTTSQFSIYSDRGSMSTSNGNTASLNANANIWIGSRNPLPFLGYITETILYNSVLSEANLRVLQRDQARYWNAPTTAYVPRVLDSVGSATAAYGLRKLRNGYAGSAIRVRRSSDNAEQDIGFVQSDYELDISRLLSFAGSGNAYITTWYDQSGNGINATQSTAASQPIIVYSGTLETINNRPAIRFDNHALATVSSAAWPSGSGARTLNAVYKFSDTSATYQALVHWGTNSSGNASRLYKSASLLGFFGNVQSVYGTYGLDTTTVHTLTATHNAGTANVYLDGTLAGTGAVTLNTTANTPLQIGTYSGAHMFKGHLSEILIYNSELSNANRTFVDRNQLQYFAPENQTAYVTKWYDQSGNGNNVEERNHLLQPFLSFQGKGGNTTLPTVVFDGRSRLASDTGFPISSNYSISAVFSNRTNSSNVAIVSSTSTATAHSLFVVNNLGGKYLTLWHGAAFATSSQQLTDNSQYAVLATYVHSSRLGTLYQQNTSVATGTAGASTTNGTIRLGAYHDESYFDGTINEVIVLNKVLSTAERNALYTSQQATYGTR